MIASEKRGPPYASAKRARRVQKARFAGRKGGPSGNVPLRCNADMGPTQVREFWHLDEAGKNLP
jgi:hypothetical protein